LETWERDFHIFNVIQGIRFFQQYPMWKSFRMWSKGMRRRKMKAAQRSLNQRLFLLNATLRSSMSQLRRLCVDVSQLGLFEMPERGNGDAPASGGMMASMGIPGKSAGKELERWTPPSVEEFLREQVKKRALLADWLIDFSDDVRALVRSACDQVLDAFLARNQIEADHPMTFTEKAALRTECRRLVKFVRLCDMLIRDTLLEVGIESTENLLEYLHPTIPVDTVTIVHEIEDPKKKGKKKEREVKDFDKDGHRVYEDGTNSEDEREEEEKMAKRAAAAAHPCEVRLLLTAEMTVEQIEEVRTSPRTSEGGTVEPQGAEDAAVEASSPDVAGADVEAEGEGEEKKTEEALEEEILQLCISTIKLSISREFVVEEVVQAIDDAIRVLAVPDPIMSHKDLQPYVRGANAEGGGDASAGDNDDAAIVPIDQQVQWTPRFKDARQRIMAHLNESVASAEAYLSVFAPFQRTFEQNEGTLVDVGAAFAETPLDEMEESIANYRSQGALFNDIPRLADVGFFRVTSIIVRTQLLPSPVRCLAAIQDLLPQLIRDTTETLGAEIAHKISNLAAVATGASEYISQKVFHKKCVKEFDDVGERFDRVQRMVGMVENNFGKDNVPDDIKAHNRMLKDSKENHDSAVEATEQRLDGDMPKWTEVIKGQVSDLRSDVENLADLLKNPIIADVGMDPNAVIEFLQEQQNTVNDLKEKATNYESWQTTLELDVDDYEDLGDVSQDANIKLRLWTTLQNFDNAVEELQSTQLEGLDLESISRLIMTSMKTAGAATRALDGNPVAPLLKGKVDDFKLVIPSVEALLNPGLQERHWQEIEACIGHSFHEERPCAKYSLGELLELDIADPEKSDTIQAASTKALQEKVLKDMFREKIRVVWKHLEFEVMNYKERHDTFILGGIEPVMEALDDSLVTLNTILGSRYCAPIRYDVTSWQKKLVLLSETLDEWMQVQQQWMYLETIFGAADIQRQLPAESKKFFDVDKGFRMIMESTNEVPKAAVAGTVQGRKNKLAKYNITLDKIQKSLEAYLETKRQAFPRFYFLSNDELLEILAQVRDPHAVQPHLQKIFDCIQHLGFGEKPGSIDIVSMRSPEKEVVPLGKNLKARGNVEDWLMAVQDRMQKVLHDCLKEATLDYERRPRVEWIVEGGHPGQCVATAAQIMWSRRTEEVLRAADTIQGGMKKWEDENIKMVLDLVVKVRGKLSRIVRKILVALITTDVHAKDMIVEMRKGNVDRVNNFAWEQQLRYYWDATEDDCIIRHANAKLYYCYEYMGCTSRLVITPLTDKCWLTITGAIHLKLGASPAGPAGTGKTESSKDLAKAMGTFCIVFNCSDQIDYIMIGKLFAGLAQCGCWCCLDEFNRILIEVLSVVAQQLLVLRTGMKSGVERINFEGRNIALKSHCVIVTMNPGYAGRTALPDNLKICFRPVAMMVPNYALIAEIVLYAQGFEDARNLARKMAKLYILASEQLSQQPHYDYGLRAVISVLIMAGGNKRSNPDMTEDVVLIKAMRDSNLPKFLADDVPLFRAILVDLFPGVEVPTDDYGALLVAIKDELREQGYQEHPALISKIIQLHDMVKIRFGVTIVGPSCGGKTVAYKIMCDAHSRLKREESPDPWYQNSILDIINPKSITMGELYGEFNAMTQEWTDGLGSTMIRAQVREVTDDRLYTMFDGPIDTLWIESLNTVLDDNRMLCLANGERIRLKNLGVGPSEMRMLFEVEDLEQASPATVSRLGVVFYTPSTLGWKPYVKSWMVRDLGEIMGEAMLAHLNERFETSLDEGLKWRKRYADEPIATTECQTARAICNIFTAQYVRAGMTKEDYSDDFKSIVDKMFGFAFVWAVGGSVHADKHADFDDFQSDVLGGINFGREGCFGGYVHTQAEWAKVPADDPMKGNDPGPKGAFRSWKEIIPGFDYKVGSSFFDLVVPTLDTTRYSFLLRCNFERGSPCFFTGYTGTGKTVIMEALISDMARPKEEGGENVLPILTAFSGQTAAKLVQLTIESKLEKKRKDLMGPPLGMTTVILVDDVNMPTKEEYGAQPPIELVRHLLCHKFFYDRDKLFLKNIADFVLFSAAAPPGGGRADMTQRFSQHFQMLCLPPSSDEVLQSIFEAILTGFTSKCKFDEATLGNAPKMVQSTIMIYQQIANDLRPTPAKSHYTFNLRDVAKVFQGCMMVRAKEVRDDKEFCRLWIHEIMRVFCDRLVNVDDTNYFQKMVAETAGRAFTYGWSQEDLFDDPENPLIFTNFLRPPLEDGTIIYEPMKDVAKAKRILTDQLDDYNMSNPTQMKLVFFRDAIAHVCRISRILMQPRGNAMLIGVGGSGKQSVTRMACHMMETRVYQIEMIRGYNHMSFIENLKEIMLYAGVEGKSIAFMLVDTQIVNESFLEDVNNILNTGQVPNMFASDEYNKICEDLRPVMKKDGIDTRDGLRKAFLNRVRTNLHIVLCHSPVGDALRVRCREFPSLINCTTIDWFNQWPVEALTAVAMQFLAEVDLGDEAGMLENMCESCARLHWSVGEFGDDFFQRLRRKVYTTPKSFLDMIVLYIELLDEYRGDQKTQQSRLKVGVKKLEETNAIVDNLQVELTALAPVLVKKGKEAEEMIIVVTEEQAKAKIVQERVEKDEAIVGKQAAETKVIADDAQADLDEAMPAFNNALKALDALEKKDIQEIKSFTTPPPAVATVMEAILILFGRATDWKTAKGLLGEMNFMEQLVKFDKDNIAPKKIKKLNKYIKNPIMEVDAVAKVSSAAKSLCMWVHAMHVYDRVAKTVGPKKALLAKMNKELDAANATLKEKQDQLAEVKAKVAGLEKTLADTLAEKKQLEDDSATTARRLQVAEKLTGQLAEEQVSWGERVHTFGESIHRLVGDVFIASASVSYYGPFTGLFRKDMVASWIATCQDLKIPISETADLRNTYNDEVQIRQWQIEGLPSDSVSASNAIMVTKGKRWPLMIDPQEQAKKWVKKMEAKSKIALTRLTDRNMLRDLENCIRIGKPLLIEDIGEILDPGLEPVLQKATFRQGGRLLIRLGDSDVDYDPNFRFYLTTKMPNPHYLPEVCIKVTVINFTVTTSGLEDQLLGDVVVQERPDVEERMNKLVASMAADAKQMQIIDAKILKSLSESEGNILDDVELIQTLDDSKLVAGMIKERMSEADVVMAEIAVIRAGYTKAAVRGSIMYFVMANMANIDPMYQYSLAYFKVLFNECIEKSEKDGDIDARVDKINQYALENIYSNVCRGLFEKDKFIFSLLLCIQIMLDRGDVNPIEWSLVLRGAGLSVNPVANPDPVMQSQLGWNLLFVMEEKLPQVFPGLTDAIASNWKRWFRWARSEFPHREPLPDQAYEEDLTDFQRILLVMALRQEKGSAAAALFVEKKFGRQFVENPPVRLESIYADTNCRLPAVFILSSGADPTGLVYALAKKMNYSERLSTISLGQGQGPKAMKMIENAKKSGDWVMLQNCHLAKSWMITLESICNEMAILTLEDGRPNKIHDDFRLYLTSMPANYFPVPVLQNSVKMTVEPPRGLRANILRTLTLLPDWTSFDDCEGANGVEIFRRLAFSTCFFHAMVQERVRFGPLGWNIPYEFNDSDVEASILLLKMFLEEQPDIPWDSLHFMSAVVGYGGRVTDFLDERCIETVLRRFYSPEVLDKGHMFDDKGVYALPPGSGSLDDFKAYVIGLPLVDPPSVFGMHPNATITVETAQTKYVMHTCLSIQPRDASGGGGGGKTTDEVVTELAVGIADRFPPVLTHEEAGPLAFVMRGEYMDSLSTALKQEMVRYNRVVRKLETTLFDIQRAIRGEVLMSAELDEQYTAMNNNQVPANWANVAFPSLKPLASWVTDMIARVEFMRLWLHNGEPVSFWLGGFFFPQGFMTGVSQNYSRKYKVAIDTLKWAFKCTQHETHEAITEQPEDGVWIFGCYMDGASFDVDNGYIIESKPAQNFKLLPVIQFLPKANHVPAKENYETPCYKTTARFGMLSTTGMSTNYVLNIELKCPPGVSPNKWVLMGVACVVNLDD
jgi:dynein heavy chain